MFNIKTVIRNMNNTFEYFFIGIRGSPIKFLVPVLNVFAGLYKTSNQIQLNTSDT